MSYLDRLLDIPAALRRMEDTALAQQVNMAGHCRNAENPDAWFPIESHSEAAQVTYAQTARELCAGCPVQTECLLLALRAESRPCIKAHGIFGARSPWQRDRLRRNLRDRRISLRLPTVVPLAQGGVVA
jgi:hypothetical protein